MLLVKGKKKEECLLYLNNGNVYYLLMGSYVYDYPS